MVKMNQGASMFSRIITFTTALSFSSLLLAASLPDIKMPDNGLSFKMIEGYQNYKIVATHWRTDKNELRYVLANPIAYKALKSKKMPMPEGSKIVKIGWSVKPMGAFADALEADKIQRVEYMVKDSTRYNQNGDHWGYARYVKKGESYVPYANGSAECIACHAAVSGNDYLFSGFQETF
jgi:hypothetical protein